MITQNRHVFIVLSDTGSLLTRMIKWVTKAPYNHVSLSFDSTFERLYSFGRKRPYNPFWGGFVVESFHDGTFKRFKNTRCKVLRIEVDEQNYQRLKEYVRGFVDHEDRYFYDFIGLISAAFNVHYDREYGYYCSEFVAEAMAYANFEFWDTPHYQVQPDDFNRIESLETIYEGMLSDYKHISL